MKRFATAFLTIALALSLAGCGSSGTESQPVIGGGSGTESSGDSATITTVDELKTALQADHSSADWYADLTGMSAETVLGAPVLVVDMAWGMANADWDAINAKRDAMLEAIWSYDSPAAINIWIRDADGTVTQGGSTTVGDALPMAETFELPAAPGTAQEVKGWLDTVYGPGGLVTLGADETWYDSITSIAMEDVGSGPQLTVATTLGASDVLELAALQTALYTSGSPQLASWAVRGADGFYTAIGGGVPDVGGNGLFYPPE